MKRKLIHNGLSLLTAAAVMFVALSALAQQVTGTPRFAQRHHNH